MPYPMIHMCIAKKVLELNPNVIEDLPQYYLGGLAPDAVHFRDGFMPEDKKVTHLCVGDELWGEATNNDEWIENVLLFFKNNMHSSNSGFLYGYCVHVLADIRNNIDFWIPLKLKLYNSLKIPSLDVYDSEAYKCFRLDQIYTDNRLYKTVFLGEIRDFLCKSKGITMGGVVIEEEINRIRDNILYNQYREISGSSYTSIYATYEAFLNFIDKTANIVSEIMF